MRLPARSPRSAGGDRAPLRCRRQQCGDRCPGARQPRRRADSADRRPSLAAIEWIDPLMAAGNWMPELVRLAGGVPLFGEAGRHSPTLAWDQLRAADPERIIIIPCGFDIARTLSELPG